MLGHDQVDYLDPNAVVDLISASTLLGRYLKGPGSIFNCSRADFTSVPIDATVPTCTPRSFTFRAVFHHQTRPVRHQRERDVGVEGAGERRGGECDQDPDQDE